MEFQAHAAAGAFIPLKLLGKPALNDDASAAEEWGMVPIQKPKPIWKNTIRKYWTLHTIQDYADGVQRLYRPTTSKRLPRGIQALGLYSRGLVA